MSTLYSLFQRELRERPDAPIIGIPSTVVTPDEPTIGTVEVRYDLFSYRQLYTLTLFLAKRYVDAGVLSCVGTSGKQLTVALVAPSNGLSYVIHELCLMHLGYCCALVSPNNSQAAIEHLLKSMDSSVAFYDASTAEKVRPSIEKSHPMIDYPTSKYWHTVATEYEEWSLDELELAFLGTIPRTLSAVAAAEGYAYKSHSSGSTGMPKMLAIPHASAVANMDKSMGLAAMTTLPLFHNHGHEALWRGIASGKLVYVYPMSRLPPTAQAITAALSAASACSVDDDALNVRHLYTVPFTLRLFVQSDNSKDIDTLAQLDLVTYGGSQCPVEVGQTLVDRGVRLAGLYGMTEVGGIMSSYRDFENDKLWQYLRPIQTRQKYLRWDVIDPDENLYELVVLAGWPGLAYSNNPDGSYSTSDVFRRRKLPGAEEEAYVYKHEGRLDDTLVHSSGEKTNPVPIEAALRNEASANGVPIIDALVFVGAGKHLPGAILIVPASTPHEGVLEYLKGTIEAVNKTCPSHSRLLMELIEVVTEEEVKLPTTDKGTLARTKAYKDPKISRVIEDVYRRFEEGDFHLASMSKIVSREDAFRCIVEALGSVVNLAESVPSISNDTAFVDLGVDSLGASRLRALLLGKLAPPIGKGVGMELSANVVFEAHTVGALTDTLLAKATASEQSHEESISPSVTSKEQADKKAVIEELIKTYSAQISTSKSQATPCEVSNNLTVLLTGSTGFLGTSVLSSLRSLGVRKVYALVRAMDDRDAKVKLNETLRKRKLPPVNVDKVIREDDYLGLTQVIVLAARFERPDFGLKKHVLDQMRKEINHVIHIAWPVNFLWPIEAFKPQFDTLIHLIDFASSCDRRPSLTFASSVSTVLNAQPAEAAVPECRSRDSNDALEMGYARSKWVAEALLDAAANTVQGMAVNVIRIGQLSAHSKTGIWNDVEAWPLLLRGSQEVGLLADVPPVRWLPVDEAAKALIKVATAAPQGGSKGARFVHLVHPHVTPWTVVHRGLQDAGLPLPLAHPYAWLQKMRKAATLASAKSNPALKLMHVWEQRFGKSSQAYNESGASPSEAVEEESYDAENAREFHREAWWEDEDDATILRGPLSTAYIQRCAEAWIESGFLHFA